MVQPLKIHPFAELLPMPSDADMQTLVNSIKNHGQLVPIMVLDDQIVDGRSRYFGCNELGIQPKTAEWVGPSERDDLTNAVIQLNLARRHLTMAQKMAVAANAMEAFEAEAKVRQVATLKQNATVATELPERESKPVETGESRAFAGKAFNLGTSYVEIAKPIAKQWAYKISISIEDNQEAEQDILRHLIEASKPPSLHKTIGLRRVPVSGYDTSVGNAFNACYTIAKHKALDILKGRRRAWRRQCVVMADACDDNPYTVAQIQSN